MKKLLFLFFCLCLFQKTYAQFGNTPQVLTQSTNSYQFQIQAADIDGDGDQDVLCLHAKSLLWYENVDGLAHFSIDHELMPINILNQGVNYQSFFTDLNGDGLPDIVADRYWMKNLGAGNYDVAKTIFSSTLYLLCDVDGDDLSDGFVSDGSKFFWQRNLGNGQFAAKAALNNAQNISMFAAADMNLDGKQDFFARQNDGFYFYKNLGNNTFEAVKISAGTAAHAIAQDFNADGKMDLLTALGGDIIWYEFDSAGNWTLRQTVSTEYRGAALALGDLDADGNADIFGGSIGTASNNRPKYFSFDATTGLFETAPKLPNTSALDIASAQIIDLDGDALSDILTSTAVTFTQSWMQNLGAGSFSNFKSFNRLLGLARDIEIADLENDGDLDIFAVGIVLENLGSGNYAEKKPATAGGGSRAFSGDLDGDGVKDLALPFGDSISWRKGLGNGQFGVPKLMPGLVTSCKQVAGGDLDNDGDIDIFACNGTDAVAFNARFYWFENDGLGNFTGHLIESDIQLCSSAFALDANEDGLLDMVLLFFNNSPALVYENLGNGIFSAPKSLLPSGTPSPPNVNQEMLVDLDLDGKLDYVFSTDGLSSTKVAWFRNMGAAGFSTEKTLATMAHQGSSSIPFFTVFDANMDGFPDVVVSDFYWSRFLFVRGLGNSLFASATTVYDESGFGNFYGVAPHDVDGDGKLDLVYGNTNDFAGNDSYNRISWLKNVFPNPAPALQLIYSTSSCDDGGTPLIASDDIQILTFKVSAIGNASFGNQYVLFDELAEIPLDTFYYGVTSLYRLPPGSAGLNLYTSYSFRDLNNPTIKKSYIKPNIPTCSPDAPPAIGILDYKAECDDYGTPADPSDDRVKLSVNAYLYNDANQNYYYTVQSNLGVPMEYFDNSDQGFYTFPEIFYLPEGSAGVPGQVIFSFRDNADTTVFKELIFDNPGTCATNPPPCPAAINYSKQSQIDAFPATYPTCKVIEGSVTIKESTATGAGLIENLNGFAGLEIIRGGVAIESTHLQNLSGLQNLDSISVGLNLYNNSDLATLLGLESLKNVDGGIGVVENPNLENFDGLDSLNTVNDGLLMLSLPKLSQISGLSNLVHIGGDLLVSECLALSSLSGLENLKNIGTADNDFSGTLSISTCQNIKSLTGLDHLDSISLLFLYENPNLENLDGMLSLQNIRNEIYLFGNPALQNLHGLSTVNTALTFQIHLGNNEALHDLQGTENLDLSNLKKLIIRNSAQLSVCAQPNICAYLENGGAAIIDSNLLGCNSVSEILTACDLSSTSDFPVNVGFDVFPNPISAGDALQILLENNFFGKVKIEILSLDERVLQVFEQEKTTRRQAFEIERLPAGNAFLVRVSDGICSGMRLVVRF